MQIGGQTDVCESHKAEAGDFRKLVQPRPNEESVLQGRRPAAPKGAICALGEFSRVTILGQMTVDGHAGTFGGGVDEAEALPLRRHIRLSVRVVHSHLITSTAGSRPG
jgi:hypothetical protein